MERNTTTAPKEYTHPKTIIHGILSRLTLNRRDMLYLLVFLSKVRREDMCNLTKKLFDFIKNVWFLFTNKVCLKFYLLSKLILMPSQLVWIIFCIDIK